MTKERLLSDENLLACLELPEYELSVYLVYTGGTRSTYYCYRKDRILFFGNDYKPSPMYGVESLESICDLLSFLTVQPGDTDDDYFKNYTSEQMEWAKSFKCEELKGLLNDFENTSEDKEYRKAAIDILTKGYTVY